MILYQNYSNNYPFFLRIRRYKSLLKLLISPTQFGFLISSLINLLVKHRYYFHVRWIKVLSRYYLDLNLWSFYKEIISWPSGILSTNLNPSYTFWIILNTLNHLKPFKSLQWEHTSHRRSFQEIQAVRLVSIAIQDYPLHKLFWLVVLFSHRLFTSGTALVNITYAYILFLLNFNFFTFLNNFYFRIYNY